MENQTLSESQSIKNPLFPKIILGIIIILSLGILIYFYGGQATQNGEATLSWNANTESDLAGYKIYYGISTRTNSCPDGGYPQKVDVGKTNLPEKPSYKLEKLENGKIYYFSITSYDTVGNESCFSDEMSKTIPAADGFWLKKIVQNFKKMFN